MKVSIIGAGNVGRAVALSARRAGHGDQLIQLIQVLGQGQRDLGLADGDGDDDLEYQIHVRARRLKARGDGVLPAILAGADDHATGLAPQLARHHATGDGRRQPDGEQALGRALAPGHDGQLAQRDLHRLGPHQPADPLHGHRRRGDGCRVEC